MQAVYVEKRSSFQVIFFLNNWKFIDHQRQLRWAGNATTSWSKSASICLFDHSYQKGRVNNLITVHIYATMTWWGEQDVLQMSRTYDRKLKYIYIYVHRKRMPNEDNST